MTNKIPTGPEDIPLRQVVKSFPIIISIFKDDKLVREEQIDYSNIEHRKWLGRITYWACNEGYTVETRANK